MSLNEHYLSKVRETEREMERERETRLDAVLTLPEATIQHDHHSHMERRSPESSMK